MTTRKVKNPTAIRQAKPTTRVMSDGMRARLAESNRKARAASILANQYRQMNLVLVSEGHMSVLGFVELAATLEGKPLAIVDINKLLLQACGSAKASLIVRAIRHKITISSPTTKIPDTITVGWIINGNGRGRRFTALVETLDEHTQPWAGYPLTRRPTAAADLVSVSGSGQTVVR